MRHGGRRTDTWRELWVGTDLSIGREVYRKHWLAFRNGGIALVDCLTEKAVSQDGIGNWRNRP